MVQTEQTMDRVANSILGHLENMDIIDCHEHLPPEASRVQGNADILTLFSHYCRGDLASVIRDKCELDFIYNDTIQFSDRWAVFKKHYACIKHTAYARAAHIALLKFYGTDRVDDETVEGLNAAISAANKPGLYKKVLNEACKIKTCLTQNNMPGITDEGLLTHVLWGPGPIETWKSIGDSYCSQGESVGTLDELVNAAIERVDRVKRCGGVGMKFFVWDFKGNDRQAALDTFEFLKSHTTDTIPHNNPLQDYVMSIILDRLAQSELVACIHTGYWGDYRTLNPSYALPIVSRHPDTNFDIYHVGYPYVREAIMLGKVHPNVWLNMCWTYIISQKFAFDALDEILEMVPVSKILGFGGDYFVVEKVYGHLVMARETISKVLAKKVVDGYFTYDEALTIAELILVKNPETLYHI